MGRSLALLVLSAGLFTLACSCAGPRTHDVDAARPMGRDASLRYDSGLTAAEEVDAYCVARETGAQCTPDCLAAVDEASSLCVAEYPPGDDVQLLLDCARSCAVGFECPGRPYAVECSCADACLRQRPEAFIEAVRDLIRCQGSIIADACFD